MANNFSGDSNCVALWDMESGALLEDSLDIQSDLTDNNTVTNDTTNQKVGTGCGDFEKDNSEYLSLTDAALSADFPGNGTQGTFSMCFWIKFESLASGRGIAGKFAGSSGYRGYSLKINASSQFEFNKGLALNASSYETFNFGTAFSTGRWYHVGVTYDDSSKGYRIRIWDDTAAELLGTDVTGTASDNIYIGAADFKIGYGETSVGGYHDGLIDEFVVFKDVLTSDEIDQIRAGTYGAAGGETYTASGSLSVSGTYNRHLNISRSQSGAL